MTDNYDIERSVEITWGVFRRLGAWLARVLLWIALAYVIYRVRSVVISVLASIVLTYALLPAVDWLACRRIGGNRIRPKTRRLIATIVVFTAFLALAGLCIALFITPFQEELNQFSSKVGEYTVQLGEVFQSASDWYKTQVPPSVKEIVGKLDYTRLTAGLGASAQRLLQVTTSSVEYALELILIPVLAFYFLLDYKGMSREMYGLVSPAKRREALKIGRAVGEILQSYVFGQIILCALAGILTGGFLYFVGLPYVVVLALFAGVTRAIPIIGPVVSGIPIILVGLVYSNGALALPLYLLLFIVVMHFAESKFIMPKLIGYRLHLHAAAVIIVLLIGAEFMGVVGMFIAAPVAAIVREMLRLYYIKPREQRECSRDAADLELIK